MKYKNEEGWQERAYEEQEQCKHNDMENKEQYYTPEINELYVGYECEIKPLGKPEEWMPCHLQYEKGNNMAGMYKLYPRMYAINKKPSYETSLYLWIKDVEHIRTKYLSKEDIVAEGWIEYNNSRGEMDQPWYVSYRHKSNPNLLLNHTAHINDVEYEKISDTISIYEDYNKPNEAWAYHQKWLYNGKCPSKNELRKLHQWLKIK